MCAAVPLQRIPASSLSEHTLTWMVPCTSAWRTSLARLIAVAAMTAFAATVLAASPLFPRPLHLTRRIEDPVSHSTATVHEYCAGDQVITIGGEKIAIADHGRQELTEIDRAAGTYSVTTFAALAEASMALTPLAGGRVAPMTANRERWTVMPRSSDAFEIKFTVDAAGGPAKMDVTLDRNVQLSKAALEVLIGASFPHPRGDVHEAILNVASNATGGSGRRPIANNVDASYALPIEQSVTFTLDGETITVKSTVIDVRAEVAPPGMVTIPPGARRIESNAVRLARELREADQLPNTPRQ